MVEEPFFVAALFAEGVFEGYHVAFPYGSDDGEEFGKQFCGFGAGMEFLGRELAEDHVRWYQMGEDSFAVREVLLVTLVVC